MAGTAYLHGTKDRTFTLRRSRNSDELYHDPKPTSSKSKANPTTASSNSKAKANSKSKTEQKKAGHNKKNVDGQRGLVRYLRVLGLGLGKGTGRRERRRLTKVRVWTDPMV